MRPGPYRLLFLFMAFCTLVAVIAIKLVGIQIVDHDRYRQIAEDQHGFTSEIPPIRGSILDRNGRPLAVTQPAYQVFADPQAIDDPAGVAKLIDPLVPAGYRQLKARFSDPDSRFKIIDHALDVDVAERLRDMDIEGIYLEPSGKRIRPHGYVASNVIGCLSGDGRPLGGIELALEAELKGTPGMRRYLRDALGNPRPCVGAPLQMPKSGSSVVLTLDADLQTIAEDALDEAVEANGALGGCVVVVDPASGDVLALVSNPRKHNFPVRTVFEPGSALKICTYAAAVELGHADTTEVFPIENGRLKVAGGWIRDDHPHDSFTFTDAFALSSNVVAATLARRVGEREFYRCLSAFGFGAKAGIDLEGESAGILREPDKWCRRSLESIAIGQEIGVTAIQLTMAYAAVANGGTLMRPRLIKAITDDCGSVKHRYPAKTVRRVIRKETAVELTRLLESVVQGGTGDPASINGVRVAGKTGTGQKAEGGRYIPGKFYSVFAGFIPAAGHTYVCTVVVDEPSGKTHYGGPVCGPVFRKVMGGLLRMDKPAVPSDCLRLVRAVAAHATGPDAVAASCVSLSLARRETEGDVVPSVLGLTLREASRVLAEAGIRWRAKGSGLVVRQDPQPLAATGARRLCRLTLDIAR